MANQIQIKNRTSTVLGLLLIGLGLIVGWFFFTKNINSLGASSKKSSLTIEQKSGVITATFQPTKLDLGLEIADRFGDSVSLDGDRLAIGAPGDEGDSGPATGAVYIFKRTNTNWVLEDKIVDQAQGFDDLNSRDFFGHSVSLDGDRLAVGAYGDTGDSGADTGAVYIFKRMGATWTLEQKLADQKQGFNNLSVYDSFGYSVSLVADRLAVGAPYDHGHSGPRTGAVYIFRRDKSSWVLEREILDISRNGFTNLAGKDEFGSSVFLTSDRLVVGAPYDDGASGVDTGAAYIFRRQGLNWYLEHEISDRGWGFINLDSGDNFGSSVFLTSDRLVVGAPYDDGASGIDTGAAYIFQRNGSSWHLYQEIVDSSNGLVDLAIGDQFGASVALNGDRLAVGSPRSSKSEAKDGVGYIFQRMDTTWRPEQKLSNQSDTPANNDWFGGQVSLGANTLVFGAAGDNSNKGFDVGSVYIFGIDDNTWSLSTKLPDAQSVAIDRTWQNFKTTNSTEPKCDSNDTFGAAKTTANSAATTNSDGGNWLCFRVQDSVGVYHYAKHRITKTNQSSIKPLPPDNDNTTDPITIISKISIIFLLALICWLIVNRRRT